MRTLRTGGFTLMELMVAVGIVAVLARIAIPSYQAYVIRANRADAQQTLLRAAQGMERYAITNGNSGYTSAALASLAVVASVTQSPQNGTAIYTMAFSGTPSSTAFTIQATPVSTGVNKNDGYLQINQTGTKVWQGHTDWTH